MQHRCFVLSFLFSLLFGHKRERERGETPLAAAVEETGSLHIPLINKAKGKQKELGIRAPDLALPANSGVGVVSDVARNEAVVGSCFGT